MSTIYLVSKKHTAGLLAGLVTNEITAVKFAVGFVCERAIGGGSYAIERCVEITSVPTTKLLETLGQLNKAMSS